MKIYSRTGDEGETSLFGGKRVKKNTQRIHAYGTVDELNACVGLAIASGEATDELADLLRQLQNELFIVGADLATPLGVKEVRIARVSDEHIRRLEREIDRLEETLEPLEHFILPGGTKRSALLHLARTICRRAERETITLGEREELNVKVSVYLNRLSDLLFILARVDNKRGGQKDIQWNPSF